MIQASFTVTPSAGDVYGTEFTFVNTTSSENIRHIAWDFGDNSDLNYHSNQPTHIYQYPGTYTITLTSVNESGNSGIFQQNITVDYAHRDYVLFTQIPDVFANPGKKTNTPFKVQVLTTQLNSPVILNLFCANSNSIPYEHVPKRWSFLNPTWKFTDTNDTVITNLSVESKPIYKNDRLVALSGEAEFYFVDSTSTGIPGENCPIILTCTLETSGVSHPLESSIYPYPTYANNRDVRGALVWHTNNLQPNLLKVTSNYIDEMYPQYWEDNKVPFLITPHFNRANELSNTQDDISNIIFTYPKTNALGLIAPVSASLTNVSPLSYTFDEAPLYFQALDKDNFRAGGYIFTTFTSQQTASNTSVLVSATVPPYSNFQEQVNNIQPNPFVFISNPELNTINKILFGPVAKNCQELDYYKSQNILTYGNIRQIPVPALSSNNTFNYGMSGFSGIYSIAIDPRDYSFLACDVELERIYKFSSTGELLSTLELSILEIPSLTAGNFTPSSITLDKSYNFWVTFFNNLSVIKFDPDFNVSFIASPNSPTPINYSFDGDFLLKPAVAETDKDNNCWVTYAHPLCSSLVKYGSGGNVITQIPLNDYSVPVALAVNLDNNVWVANITNVLSAAGSIQLYDNNTYTLIKSITGIPRPSYLTVDNFNNLWFTHSLNGLGYYNTTTDILSTWSISNNIATPLPADISLPAPDVFINDEEIGGLGIDTFNRVWLINSYTNTANVIITASPNFTNNDIYTFKIRPKDVIGYNINLNTGATITETLSTYNYRSAQASGDWTGLKWYQKYINFNQNSKVIKGESVPFNIIEFVDKYRIRRINESFNTSEYYKSLALPEILKNNPFLWDKFFAAAVGTADLSANEDLGQVTYERIANFLANHADIDTCNIDQLISLANETNVFAANYAIELPAEIKRMLDIASVSKNKLFGVPDNQPILKESLGAELNPYTTTLSAGTQIVLKSKLDNLLTLLTVPIQDNNIFYPLSAFYGYGFAPPIISNYQFYTYEPQYSGKYIENIIDWNSTFTTLNSTVSTFEEWYGENGVLETTFNYLLTKNLFLK